MRTAATQISINRLATVIAGSTAVAATLAGIATTTAPPANAAPKFAAAAYSHSDGAWGMSRLATSQQQATDLAMAACTSPMVGGKTCVLVASTQAGLSGDCVAIGRSRDGASSQGATAGSEADAKAKALAGIAGGEVVASTCAGGDSETGLQGWGAVAPLPAAQAPAPAPAPKQGPTVSWDPIVGGLVAHITDRSGVSSQCTYTSDFFTRSFALNANSTVDLKIVPAIPQFRTWDVTISCDNGTKTQTNTFF